MPSEHENIQKWIRKKYSGQFRVLAETIDGQNRLPDWDRHWYQPDVILKSLSGPNDIRYIIEVEGDPVRKAIVGACLLADRSVEEMRAKRAGLIFIIYSKGGKKQINDFRAKVEVIRRRLLHLSSIQVVTDADFKRGKGFEIRSTRKKKDAFDKKLREGERGPFWDALHESFCPSPALRISKNWRE